LFLGEDQVREKEREKRREKLRQRLLWLGLLVSLMMKKCIYVYKHGKIYTLNAAHNTLRGPSLVGQVSPL
jgi:hypothetical protein